MADYMPISEDDITGDLGMEDLSRICTRRVKSESANGISSTCWFIQRSLIFRSICKNHPIIGQLYNKKDIDLFRIVESTLYELFTTPTDRSHNLFENRVSNRDFFLPIMQKSLTLFIIV